MPSFTQIVENIKKKETKNPPTSILVAKEGLETPNPHLHILIEFDKKRKIENPRAFDYILGKHGKYETVRKLKQTVNYLVKEGNFAQTGKPFYVESLADVRKKIRTLIEEGMKPSELITLGDEKITSLVYMESPRIEAF